MYGREGSTVLLSCGDGVGEGVEWVKDGRVPVPSDKGRVWLHNVSHAHEGEYTCSYERKKSHNYYLIVQGMPIYDVSHEHLERFHTVCIMLQLPLC